MVVKNWTKKTFEIFFSSMHASQKLLYSLRYSTYMKIVNSTWFYGSATITFTQKIFIWTTFVTQSFDLKMTIFCQWHCNENYYFSDANYSIKHNIHILLYSILQIHMCLRIQNLKKNWKLDHKQRRYSHFQKLCFSSLALATKIATFQMQITQ